MRVNMCMSIRMDGVLFCCRMKKTTGNAQTLMSVVPVTDKVASISGEPYFTQPSPIFLCTEQTHHFFLP